MIAADEGCSQIFGADEVSSPKYSWSLSTLLSSCFVFSNFVSRGVVMSRSSGFGVLLSIMRLFVLAIVVLSSFVFGVPCLCDASGLLSKARFRSRVLVDLRLLSMKMESVR